MAGGLPRSASPPTVTGLVPDDGSHSIQYSLTDLTTRSIRLSPSRAYVVRDISNIPLDPGTNHITIIGLSPTVDEHSVKLEATGPVSITDFSIHLLPNRDIYEDVYPDSDDEHATDSESEEGFDGESETNQATDPKENESTLALRAELEALHEDQERNLELVASAGARLEILDGYGRRIVSPEQPIILDNSEQAPQVQTQFDIAVGLEAYKTERERAFCDHMEGKTKARKLAQQIDKLAKQLDHQVKTAAKAQRTANKAQLRASAAKDRARQKRQRKAEENSKEKLRIRQEREACWPRNVHVVSVTLETAIMTPGSTRRSSFSSDIIHASTDPDACRTVMESSCGLTLSYMTTSAYWKPTYDLSLSTVTTSAILCFDALLTNHTSETWSNCKVSLTTSEAELADLTDRLPHLHAWQIGIADKNTSVFERASDNILHSAQELQHNSNRFFPRHPRSAIQTRSSMFGRNSEQTPGLFNTERGAFGPAQVLDSGMHQAARPGGLFGSYSATTYGTTGGFGSAAPSAFGSNSQPSGGGSGNFEGPSVRGGLFGSSQKTLSTGGALFGNAQPAAAGTTATSGTASMFGGQAFSSSLPATSGTGQPTFGQTGGNSQAASLFGVATSSSADESETATDSDTTDVTNKGHKSTTQTPRFSDVPSVNAPIVSPTFGQDDFSFEQLGLTSSYELPGLKTLKPSAPTSNGVGCSSRQRVTRITNFTEVSFTRTVVAKLKAAAYLRVKLRNSSRIPIISGVASITLDGSFLGRMQIPPPSGKALFGSSTLGCVKPGEYMHLDLGKDPSVEVRYQGPLAKTNSSGLGATAGFLLGANKDVSRVCTRHIVLSNRRAHGGDTAAESRQSKKNEKSRESGESASSAPKPMIVRVLDQVPITEDERVRVEILRPRGLTKEGDEVEIDGDGMPRFTTGNGISKKLGKAEEDDAGDAWGKAQAKLLEDGKVEWHVTLNPSKTVRLTLEYQCSYPKGESVVSVHRT